MFKKILRFFNSSSNSVRVREKINSKEPESRLAEWLSSPLEYGTKPIYTKTIEKGTFKFRFKDDMPMNYSLIEYKMTENGKREIGIVDEISIWSFLNTIDYDKIDLKKIKTAYLGKLSEIMDIRLNAATNREVNYSKEKEKKKVADLIVFNNHEMEGLFNITDVYKYDEVATFYVMEIPNADGKYSIYQSGLTDYENNVFFNGENVHELDELQPIMLYHYIGKMQTL